MRRSIAFSIVTVLLLFASASLPVAAEEALAGPITAHVERVIDGDTIAVRARVWIGQEINVLVRIDRIDAPELEKGCPASRAIALDARALVADAVEGRDVTLHHIRGDKYFGRVIADIEIPGTADQPVAGTGDLATMLLASGLARPYSGKSAAAGAAKPWFATFPRSRRPRMRHRPLLRTRRRANFDTSDRPESPAGGARPLILREFSGSSYFVDAPRASQTLPPRT